MQPINPKNERKKVATHGVSRLAHIISPIWFIIILLFVLKKLFRIIVLLYKHPKRAIILSFDYKILN